MTRGLAWSQIYSALFHSFLSDIKSWFQKFLFRKLQHNILKSPLFLIMFNFKHQRSCKVVFRENLNHERNVGHWIGKLILFTNLVSPNHQIKDLGILAKYSSANLLQQLYWFLLKRIWCEIMWIVMGGLVDSV